MPKHWEQEDRERLSPKAEAVRAFLFDQGWYELAEVARRTGIKEGTVASRLREMTDREHAYLGLAYERRRVPGKPGVHEYRLYEREPGQLPLLEVVAA